MGVLWCIIGVPLHVERVGIPGNALTVVRAMLGMGSTGPLQKMQSERYVSEGEVTGHLEVESDHIFVVLRCERGHGGGETICSYQHNYVVTGLHMV